GRDATARDAARRRRPRPLRSLRPGRRECRADRAGAGAGVVHRGVRNQGSSLQVMDAAGNRVDNNDGQVDLQNPDRQRMFVTLPPLPDGVYTVRWVTVSADDGDQAEGTFRFGVGADTVLPPQGA